MYPSDVLCHHGSKSRIKYNNTFPSSDKSPIFWIYMIGQESWHVNVLVLTLSCISWVSRRVNHTKCLGFYKEFPADSILLISHLTLLFLICQDSFLGQRELSLKTAEQCSEMHSTFLLETGVEMKDTLIQQQRIPTLLIPAMEE